MVDADLTFVRVAQSSSPDRPYAPDSMKVSWLKRHDADRRLPVETATRLRRHPYRSVSRSDRSLRRPRSHLRKQPHRPQTSPSSPPLNCARSDLTSSAHCCATMAAP